MSSTAGGTTASGSATAASPHVPRRTEGVSTAAAASRSVVLKTAPGCPAASRSSASASSQPGLRIHATWKLCPRASPASGSTSRTAAAAAAAQPRHSTGAARDTRRVTACAARTSTANSWSHAVTVTSAAYPAHAGHDGCRTQWTNMSVAAAAPAATIAYERPSCA
ncbi:hypothetical protein [Streptomyces aureus]|uniref:hypothetical protein n=1 Tax=Streptomyces aureus TaxID=193461 RepID=UPI00362FFCB0